MKKIYLYFILLTSCSDAEIVSGNFNGKIYMTDTIDATAVVTAINDAYIRLEIGSPYLPQTYVEYAQLSKNNIDAYNLTLTNTLGETIFSGYFYEDFLHVYSLTNNYTFEGTKD